MGQSEIVFDENKFAELIIYVADRCKTHSRFGATKLNKTLFFSDFQAFKDLGSPITGADYQALEYGPAPRQLLPVRSELQKAGEIALSQDGNQNRIVPLRKPNLAAFKAEEISIVDSVIEEFQSLSAEAVSEISHLHLGWKAAIIEGPKTSIPYETALVSNRQLDRFDSALALEKADSFGYAR